MTQVTRFPSEFNHHFFRDLDREFTIIWVLSFVILVSVFHYMSGIEVKEITAEELKKYTEVLYRVKAKPPEKIEKVVPDEGVGMAEEVVEEEKKEELEEKKVEVVETEQVSEQSKKEVREEKREARKERQELRKAKIQAAASRMKILAGPTAKGRRSRGGAEARAALGLTSGNVEGYDVKKMTAMVSDAGKAEKVKKYRGSGAVSEEVGDIDIEELRSIAPGDLDLMFKETSIELNRSAITAKGRGSKTKERSQSAISEIVLQNKNAVQYCYWSLKRRDSSLKGRVVVEFTISTEGEVIRVRFRKSDWGGNKLGAEVQRCITNTITTWRFDPIDAKGGNVTAGATYVFG